MSKKHHNLILKRSSACACCSMTCYRLCIEDANRPADISECQFHLQEEKYQSIGSMHVLGMSCCYRSESVPKRCLQKPALSCSLAFISITYLWVHSLHTLSAAMRRFDSTVLSVRRETKEVLYFIQYEADSICEWVSLDKSQFRVLSLVKTEDGVPVSVL